MKAASTIRRHGRSTSTKAMVLPDSHPAVVEGRPLFQRSANEHKLHKARALVSGHNSRKIGRVVTKGKWAGFPIFTLTLEERTTCPRACAMWNSCYGNRMPWSIRWPATSKTQARIWLELGELQERHPQGFVVRLHVLGDFYSVAYVRLWEWWLTEFPALHVFGYTARIDEIGREVERVAGANWDRFAIRISGEGLDLPKATVGGSGIECPAETGASLTCGTCALCWAAPDKTIVFHEH